MNWSGQRQDLRLCESGVKPKLRTNRCITGCLGSLQGSQWAGCQLTPVHHWHQASPWLWSQARQVHHPSRPSPHVAKLAFACSLARVHFEPLGPAYTAGLPHHTILPVREPALEHHPEDHFPLVFSQKAELRDQLQPKNCLETCDLNRSGEPERKKTNRQKCVGLFTVVDRNSVQLGHPDKWYLRIIRTGEGFCTSSHFSYQLWSNKCECLTLARLYLSPAVIQEAIT